MLRRSEHNGIPPTHRTGLGHGDETKMREAAAKEKAAKEKEKAKWDAKWAEYFKKLDAWKDAMERYKEELAVRRGQLHQGKDPTPPKEPKMPGEKGGRRTRRRRYTRRR